LGAALLLDCFVALLLAMTAAMEEPLTQDWNPVLPLWLFGCGNMAGAMLRRWLDLGLPAERVTVVRPSGVAPAPGIRTLTGLPESDAPPRVLLLGIKPQTFDEIAADVAKAVGPETLLVSILAGVEFATLRARFPNAGAIIRAMPNTPVAIGRGVVALFGDPGAHGPALERLMQPLGLVEWMNDEALFGAATALAGSGPAFLFRFVAALAEAGEELGLPPDQALRLATAMVDGAAGLAAGSEEHPDRLADRVASPGGMTLEGLNLLDESNALRDLVRRTLAATDRRGREMAAAAR
jgi:pyrroline-5-carboxylate reductase